jgi:tetratricopeptide (TPR) repeat protein
MGLAALVEGFREWRERRGAMADLRRLKRDDAPYKHIDAAQLLENVRTAAFREDPEGTEKAFEALRAHSPEVAISSFQAIRSLVDVGKVELAEAAIQQGLRRFPGTRDLLGFYAQMADRQRDWPEANRRWERVRATFPDSAWACYWQAMALKELGRLDEADTLLEKAMTLDRRVEQAAIQYAEIAERRGDLELALHRWTLMQERYEDQAGWVRGARLLCRMGREAEAIELLTKARWLFQSRPEPLVELAEICHRHGPSEEAVRQWAAVRDQYPQADQGFIAGALALQQLGRHEEADEVLQRYAGKQNPHVAGLVEWARSIQRRDPGEAARRWAVVREKFPDRVVAYEEGAAALDAIGETAEAERVRAQKPDARS